MPTSSANRQFLDYDGLSTFWANINNKFSNKDETVNSLTVDKDSTSVNIACINVNNNQIGEVISLPIADSNNAGIITAGTYQTIMSLEAGDSSLVPITGVCIDDKETYLNNRQSSIKLEYIREYNNENPAQSKYWIALVDSKFANGTVNPYKWNEVNKDKYDQTIARNPNICYKTDDNKYYVWNGYGEGPKHTSGLNVGTPIFDAPISKIDVTEFIKSGLLSDVSYNVNNGYKRQLELTFNVYDNEGNLSTSRIPIDLQDLIDVYTAGEGIKIEQDPDNSGNTLGDETYNTSKVSIKGATNSTLGGVKVKEVKSTYVTVDNDNKRNYSVYLNSDHIPYVNVPWHKITTSKSNNYGLNVEEDKTTGDDLTTTISLNDTTIGTLSLADSAIQELTILDITLNKNTDHNTISIDTAEKQLSLGSAAHVNFTDDATLNTQTSNVTSKLQNGLHTTLSNVNTVPTTKAVKTYTDTLVTNSINDAVENLCSALKVNDSPQNTLYIDNNGNQERHDAKYFVTGLEIQDGLILAESEMNKNNKASSTQQTYISIYDILDFCALSKTDIDEICGMNQSNS